MNLRVSGKITTIFVAIIVSAMLFPGLTEGSVETEPSILIDFGQVTANSQVVESLSIINLEDIPVTVSFKLIWEGSCGFSYDASGSSIAPNGTMVLPVTFSPLAETQCTDLLVITWKYYDEAGQPIDWGSEKITLKGTGTEAPAVDPWVVIYGQDTGVANKLYTDRYISQYIDECAAIANNHGHFVRCVADLANALKEDGIISGKEKGMLQSAAAGSSLP